MKKVFISYEEFEIMMREETIGMESNVKGLKIDLKLTCTQQGNMQQQGNIQQQGPMQQGTMSFDTQLCL